jgi:hypothetical protein
VQGPEHYLAPSFRTLVQAFGFHTFIVRPFSLHELPELIITVLGTR